VGPAFNVGTETSKHLLKQVRPTPLGLERDSSAPMARKGEGSWQGGKSEETAETSKMEAVKQLILAKRVRKETNES